MVFISDRSVKIMARHLNKQSHTIMKSRIILPFRFANYIPYKINAEISTAK